MLNEGEFWVSLCWISLCVKANSIHSLYPKTSYSESLEQLALENVKNCLNTNIYSYLETSGGQSSYLYTNVIHFFNTSVY